eukprot:603151-Prorocentrum_minimum.AAC.2
MTLPELGGGWSVRHPTPSNSLTLSARGNHLKEGDPSPHAACYPFAPLCVLTPSRPLRAPFRPPPDPLSTRSVRFSSRFYGTPGCCVRPCCCWHRDDPSNQKQSGHGEVARGPPGGGPGVAGARAGRRKTAGAGAGGPQGGPPAGRGHPRSPERDRDSALRGEPRAPAGEPGGRYIVAYRKYQHRESREPDKAVRKGEGKREVLSASLPLLAQEDP